MLCHGYLMLVSMAVHLWWAFIFIPSLSCTRWQIQSLKWLSISQVLGKGYGEMEDYSFLLLFFLDGFVWFVVTWFFQCWGCLWRGAGVWKGKFSLVRMTGELMLPKKSLSVPYQVFTTIFDVNSTSQSCSFFNCKETYFF